MTCEVCIMNPAGIVHAADSATTVTDSADGKAQTRYFKGANKILLLSHHKPVALMTFGSADLQGLPWETITKEFSNSLRDKSFNHAEDYAKELFEFVGNNISFYDTDHKASHFGGLIRVVTYDILQNIRDSGPVKDKINVRDKRKEADILLFKLSAFCDNSQIPSVFSQEDLSSALVRNEAWLESTSEIIKSLELEEVVDASIAHPLAVKFLFKNYREYIASTGLVIAGFGDHEYLPSMCEYNCYGFSHTRLLYEKVKFSRIDSESSAFIGAFAKTDMIDTFERGVGFDVYASVKEQTQKCLSDFAQEITQRGNCGVIPNLDQMINEYTQRHSNAWLAAACKAHSWPLWRVISYLPISDMAQLAETLVSLQSLKERVTAPSESVSGPIDVAAVTKGDGFVWIKRKHYFDGNINPRYFMRIQKLYSN